MLETVLQKSDHAAATACTGAHILPVRQQISNALLLQQAARPSYAHCFTRSFCGDVGECNPLNIDAYTFAANTAASASACHHCTPILQMQESR